MTTSISINFTSIARTLTLTCGLLPSSSEPLSHGLGTSPTFRRRQILQMLKELPKGTKVELRMMETWQICLISSLEEVEHPDYDLLNLWTSLYLIYCFVMLFFCDDCLKKKIFTCCLFFIYFHARFDVDGVVMDYSFVRDSNPFLKTNVLLKGTTTSTLQKFCRSKHNKKVFWKKCVSWGWK